ncbi:hypothetical protein BN159_3213 [Streptomyces davaonensis JCM 4913]|uniref:Uncharacterized protein n=1 Tax=Streptomyces davaonensis (strain DSM 101723 / JCM 4913 / KCC S-0913 / 768) TaxID=1214101 RepID=K4R383_STRDJ|nr:hypothetical protein [Streptomyces davaonensis]CCK27592.1 hypothetical protein BN159_3213 [Streptomyces davaonensis JCM 4913]
MTGPIPATTANARICPNCDGFATAAVSSGGRDHRGHLRTLTVNCPACHGHGTWHTRAAQLAGGRA